jgi:hypothetical protein
MEHFYQTVDGFMGPRNIIMFDLVLKDFPKSGTWVELGSWMGRSTAYCAVELIDRDLIGKFYCVDTWQGGDTLENHTWVLDGTIKQRFLDNIAPIAQHITPIQSVSWTAADQFTDDSVDFCYVDALHTYEGVMQDLTAWWPKIKPGAWFAGDDYTKGWPGVQQAVQEFFAKQGVRFDRSGRCWLVKKPNIT